MDVLLTCVVCGLAFFVLLFTAIGRIADAKIEINHKLCDEKIRYTREKSRIEIETLEEKKRKRLFPTNPPPQK